jgi:hypothetical protein
MTTKTANSVEVAISHIGPHGTYVEGELVDRQNPAVLANPAMFVEIGTPRDQRPTPLDGVIERRTRIESECREAERARFEAEAKQNRVKIVPELVEATTDHFARLNGRPAVIRKGSTVLADDDLVAQNPSVWRPV